MYILDNYKDYYDYLSHIYGEDKGIVFDRRNSTKLTNAHLNGFVAYAKNSYRYHQPAFLILEVGFKQHMIRVYRTNRTKSDRVHIDHVRSFDENKNHYTSPISLREVYLHHQMNPYDWRTEKRKENYLKPELTYSEVVKGTKDLPTHPIDRPILADTVLTKMFDPLSIWNDIQTYLSSLNNDLNLQSNITDTERAETHGFDRRTSFRHPVR